MSCNGCYYEDTCNMEEKEDAKQNSYECFFIDDESIYERDEELHDEK